jgi:Domain of unknown function (DUF1893).
MSILFAKSLLKNDISFALVGKRDIITDTRHGVMPLLARAEENFFGYLAADKIVGEAAAWLYALTKPDAVVTFIITTKAKQILNTAGIPCFYDKEVPITLGKDGMSRCPIEESVLDVCNPQCALEKIKEKIKTFSAK